MIWQKIDYIHANPVKARLVSSARDYRWSSLEISTSIPVSHYRSSMIGGGLMILRNWQKQ